VLLPRFVALAALFAASSFGQTRFKMRFVDEVGHLGNEYSSENRQVADLGLAKISADRGELKVEGLDEAGRPWRVRLAQVGGVGWTEVWTADFDANGRMDLLFAGHFPGVGRCIDGVEVTLMLFDGSGRPRAWTLSTMLPDVSAFPFVPIIVLDMDRNGRAEFVTTTCDRIEPPTGFGERYTLSGVYEASDAALVAMRSTDTRLYARTARQIQGLRSLGTIPPKQWRDPEPFPGPRRP
jgi:hypothetical protein